MYTITSKPDGTYTVTIQLPNTRALAEWLKSQGTDTASTSQMHSSQEAMQIARKLGHSVPHHHPEQCVQPGHYRRCSQGRQALAHPP